MSITISIIIPIYNVEKYLKQCLDSVINQSMPFDEVILVNDGSTDKSFSICEKYVSSYKNFKLLSQQNKGPSAARNIGMENATGEYIMFLDADDYLRLDTVKLLKEYLKKSQHDAMYFDADIFIDDDCDYLISRNGYDRKDMQMDHIRMKGVEYFNKCYPRNYVASACMAIYNRRLIEIEKIRFPEGMLYEDTYFSFFFMIKAKYVEHISEKLYQRRYRKNSTMTSKYTKKNFIDHVKIGLLLWDQIIKEEDSLIPDYRELFLGFTNDYFRMVLDKLKLCREYKENIDTDLIVHFEYMAKQYLMMIDKLYLESAIQNISLQNELLYNLHYIFIENLNINKGYIKQFITKIVERQKILYLDILKGLPLDEEAKTVGIYGTGNHTEGLLVIFEKIIGDIKCNLIFIDSCLDNEMYKDKKIINYRKIDKGFDLIVISSFLYEQEMIENVKEISDTIPICRFYEVKKKDIFSQYKMFSKYC